MMKQWPEIVGFRESSFKLGILEYLYANRIGTSVIH